MWAALTIAMLAAGFVLGLVVALNVGGFRDRQWERSRRRLRARRTPSPNAPRDDAHYRFNGWAIVVVCAAGLIAMAIIVAT